MNLTEWVQQLAGGVANAPGSITDVETEIAHAKLWAVGVAGLLVYIAIKVSK